MAKEKDEMAKEKSKAVKDFENFIEKYKLQNPVKYELKKAELEKQLAALSDN